MVAGKQIRRHMAWVEYLACKETVKSMLAQGFSKRMIHERLTEEGHISMAYITFCQTIQKADKKDPPAPPPKAVSSPAPLRQSQPNVIKAPADGLQDPRNIDPKSII